MVLVIFSLISHAIVYYDLINFCEKYTLRLKVCVQELPLKVEITLWTMSKSNTSM